MPRLFPLLRSLIDRRRVAGRFILLGSASPQLLQQSSESLAGRIAYLELQPITWPEVQSQLPYQQHWLRGGYLDILLAFSDRSANRRMNDFIQTYVKRDLPSLGLGASPARVRTLLSTLVSVHAEDGKLTDLQTRKADGIEMLPAKEEKEARKVIEAYADEIAQKWLDFFVLKKKPKIRKITKKLWES